MVVQVRDLDASQVTASFRQYHIEQVRTCQITVCRTGLLMGCYVMFGQPPVSLSGDILGQGGSGSSSKCHVSARCASDAGG